MTLLRLSKVCAPLAFLLFTVSPAIARNAPTPADPDAESRRLFDEGQDAFGKQDYPRAEQAFEGALDIRPTADTAINLAITEMKLDKFTEAATHLDWATRNFPPSEPDEQRARLAKLFTDAKSRVASLRIQADVEGADVTVAGEKVGATPLASEAYAAPGTITVVAHKAGFQDATETVDVSAGLSKSVNLHLEPIGGASEKPLWPALVLGGVGVAGLGAGIAVLVVGLGKEGDVEGQPCPGGACPDLESIVDERNIMVVAGSVVIGVGAAAGIGALLYLVIDPSSSDTAWAPVIGPDYAGFTMQGRF